MSSKEKNIKGESVYNSHVWLCNCNRCGCDFYNRSSRLVCDSCLIIENREKSINKILNNDIEE